MSDMMAYLLWFEAEDPANEDASDGEAIVIN